MYRVLCVTGASSDVGMCLINRIEGNYDYIICHYRSGLRYVEELKTKYGDKIIPLFADFSEEQSTRNFAKTVIEKGMTPQHFIHLSSSSFSSVNVKFGKTSWEQFEKEIAITFRSAVILSQAFLPLMAKQDYGKVIYMLSAQMIWKPAKPYATAYTCVKHALYGLMESLSAEYAPKHITVNAVSPSMIDTKFLKISELIKEMNAFESPIKRLLKPEDVVPTFEFLLSEGADTITGQNIPVTAGA